MWTYIGNNIRMTEGDYGVILPIVIKGAVFQDNDVIKITFKDAVNGTTILEQEYEPINNTVGLEFTEAESALFPIGEYVYSIDWFRDGQFLCNVTPVAGFKVFDKV